MGFMLGRGIQNLLMKHLHLEVGDSENEEHQLRKNEDLFFCWRTVTVDFIFLKDLYSFDWFTSITTFTVKMKSGHSSSVVTDSGCIVFINTFGKSGDSPFLDGKEWSVGFLVSMP